MQRWQAFKQLILARIREFFREPEVVFWVYGFPIVLAVILGAAFSGGETPLPIVDVQREPDAVRAEKIAQDLRGQKLKVEVQPEEECKKRLAHGKTSLFVVADPDGIKLWFDNTRPDCVLAQQWVEAALLRVQAGSTAPKFDPKHLTERGSRYIDFLLPGLLGINIMGGGLFGLGFVIVDMRVRKLFKRLLATPMRHGDFLMAMCSARLLFLMPEMLVLLLLGWLAFGVPMAGSLVTLLLFILVGALAFMGLGLLVGCRTEKTETISGLINLVMLPSYLLSGVFFSSSRFPDWAQPVIQALPLTQLVDGLRAIFQGQGLAEIWWRLAILAGWAAVTFALALRWFRWR